MHGQSSQDVRRPVTERSIVVSGASGMIGTALIRSWVPDPIHVTQLVRGKQPREQSPKVEFLTWNPGSSRPFSNLDRLAGADTVIHLSGVNIAAHRWTERYKREIVSSRLQSTRALASAIATLDPLPRVFVCASATGIYGDRGDEILTESAVPGGGFLAETCVAWEAAAQSAVDAGIRVVHSRFGVVLSTEGGALRKLLPLFRLGLGGGLGNGRAWMPWVTLRDAVGILRFCADQTSLSGAVNVVAPSPVTNAGFTRALAAAVHRPGIIAAPAFALRMAFGQMADEALLASARVVPQKLDDAGYRFADPAIGPALQGLLSS